MSKITYAQCTYGERENQTKLGIEQMKPYVDEILIIEDGTLSPPFLEWLKGNDCKIKTVLWTDNFPVFRNAYMEEIRNGDWVVWLDPDEYMDWIARKNLRNFVAQSNGGSKFDAISFNAVDVTIKSWDVFNPEIEVIRATDWFKVLFIQKNKNTRFTGTVHETLHGVTKEMRAPRSACYYHVKTLADIVERGARNFHAGGGGPNLGDRNPKWIEYKNILESIGKEKAAWPEMRRYLKRGNIDKELKEFIISLRNEDGYDGASEHRQLFHYYFTLLHPMELPKGKESKYAPV